MKPFQRKTTTMLTLVVLLSSLFFTSQFAAAVSEPFSQGAGYNNGAYDLNAQQPTDFNWSRHSRFYGVNKNLFKKWSYNVTTNTLRQTPVVAADGTVVFPTEDNNGNSKLIALNPDGSLKWEYSLTYPALYASPVIGNDGYVYLSAGATLTAVNLETGLSRWQNGNIRLTGYNLGSIAIGDDGTLYLSGLNGYLYAVDPAGPSIKWSAYLGYRMMEPSIDNNGVIYVQNNEERQVKVAAVLPDGTIKWNKQYSSASTNESIAYGSPLLDDQGNLYVVGNVSKKLFSIKTNDGALNWSLDMPYPLSSSPAYDEKEQVIYVGATRYLNAVNLDGTLKWQTDIGSGSNFKGSPIIDNKGEIFINSTWKLCVFSKGGTLIASFDADSGYTSNNVTIAEDGTLYFTSSSKKLIAVGGEKVLPAPTLTGLFLDTDEYSLKKGETHNTVVTAHYSDGSTQDVTDQALFTSTNSVIASVNAAGVVYGESKGNATITAQWNGYSVSANVAVVQDPEPVTVDDPLLTYTGTWYTSGQPAGYYNETDHYTVSADSTAHYSFNGTSISWYGVKGLDHGKADVYIDGVLDATVDLYQEVRAQQTLCYTKPGLTDGPHTITIVQRSDTNPLAEGNYVEVDFLQYH